MNVVKRNGADMFFLFIAIGFIVVGIFLLGQDELKKKLQSEEKQNETPAQEEDNTVFSSLIGTKWILDGNTLYLNDDMTMKYLDEDENVAELLEGYNMYRFTPETNEMVFGDVMGQSLDIITYIIDMENGELSLVFNDVILTFEKTE